MKKSYEIQGGNPEVAVIVPMQKKPWKKSYEIQGGNPEVAVIVG